MAESDSDTVRALLISGRPATSRWTGLELRSALVRRLREGHLTEADLLRGLDKLSRDMQDVELVDVTSDVLDRAGGLLVAHRLRSGDAVQLASCLVFGNRLGQPVEFVCFDQRLNAAAKAEGCPLVLAGV